MEFNLPPGLVAGDLPPSMVAALVKNHDPQWHAARRKGIGGSDAGKIMSGDLYDLWMQKTGRAEPDDLSGVLPVVMGTWTEAFNRYWFERDAGMPVDLARTGGLQHPDYSFMRANLDGRVGLGIWEGKHVNAFSDPDKVRNRYYAQCQHNMAVIGAPVCYLSVFIGTLKFVWWEIDADPEYQAELISREAEFWQLVESDTPPPQAQASDIEPVPADEMREADMTGSNEFASFAVDWLENKDAAKTFDKSKDGLKKLVDKDVKLAFGHGVQVKRGKNGALTISAQKKEKNDD